MITRDLVATWIERALTGSLDEDELTASAAAVLLEEEQLEPGCEQLLADVLARLALWTANGCPPAPAELSELLGALRRPTWPTRITPPAAPARRRPRRRARRVAACARPPLPRGAGRRQSPRFVP